MSNFNPPPRKLERSRNDRFVGGVCGGVARYLNIDPTLVRVLTVAITLFGSGIPVVLYLIALFVVPEEGRTEPPAHHPAPPPPSATGPWPTPPSNHDDAIWGTEGAPWERPTPPTPPPAEPGPAAYQSPAPDSPTPGSPATDETDDRPPTTT